MDPSGTSTAHQRTGAGASLVVINPSGNRSRIPLAPLPFTLGRQSDNHLVLRDNRISRAHARIVEENGEFFIEDLNSRQGTYVNGNRITRQQIHNSDSIEFGVSDSYRLIFLLEIDELQRLLEQVTPQYRSSTPTAGNLANLRALVEVARALQNSLSIEDVLSSVVDAALTVTGAERGFLLLTNGSDLEITVARDASGRALDKSSLEVPTKLIRKALDSRTELLSMRFEPEGAGGVKPDTTIARLALKSVVCVPLVRVRAASTEQTMVISGLNQTSGVLYLDSTIGAADLSTGNRELLQTLALEASTVLENARLLEEERTKQRIEEELHIARDMQRGLLPRNMPTTGWFRAAGWSIPSSQVGGDYFDVHQLDSGAWLTVIADVCGKGAGSALLASLLQGAFLLGSDDTVEMKRTLVRLNRFLLERAQGEKYATVFLMSLSSDGRLNWCNAGHCSAILLGIDGRERKLPANALPVGMLEEAEFSIDEICLEPGDKVILYSDGLSEAQNTQGEFLGTPRIREFIRANANLNCADLVSSFRTFAAHFTEDGPQSDDMTLVAVEYRP